MDMVSVFRSEVFRPLVTNVFPGGLAIFPFVILVNGCFPDLATYRDAHEAVYFSIVALLTIGVGELIGDVATFAESLLDKAHQRKFPDMVTEWEAYLRKTYTPLSEPIGQRYLRAILLHLKFELSLGTALFPFYLGMLLVNAQRAWFSCPFIIWLGLGLSIFFAFLMYSAYVSSRLLIKIRQNLLRA